MYHKSLQYIISYNIIEQSSLTMSFSFTIFGSNNQILMNTKIDFQIEHLLENLLSLLFTLDNMSCS